MKSTTPERAVLAEVYANAYLDVIASLPDDMDIEEKRDLLDAFADSVFNLTTEWPNWDKELVPAGIEDAEIQQWETEGGNGNFRYDWQEVTGRSGDG